MAKTWSDHQDVAFGCLDRSATVLDRIRVADELMGKERWDTTFFCSPRENFDRLRKERERERERERESERERERTKLFSLSQFVIVSSS